MHATSDVNMVEIQQICIVVFCINLINMIDHVLSLLSKLSFLCLTLKVGHTLALSKSIISVAYLNIQLEKKRFFS